MPRVAPIVPAETDILCESCGYTLNGLPPDANCPECGNALQSSVGDRRHPPPWEDLRGGSTVRRFMKTTGMVIFRPTHFYSTTTAHGDVRHSKRFARLHWVIASYLFGITGTIHMTILGQPRNPALAALSLMLIAYIALETTTWAAAKLTVWEAAYRGYRLPSTVVRRAMHYHAAHYLPVAIVVIATVAGYYLAVLIQLADGSSMEYAYILCGEVIVAAAYLFKTYWIGMRNMMYANK